MPPLRKSRTAVRTRTSSWGYRLAALAIVAIAVAGCGAHNPRTVGWIHWGNSAENTHFAALSQINAHTGRRPRVAWRRSEGPKPASWQTFPIVSGRTMYYTGNTDEVFAV